MAHAELRQEIEKLRNEIKIKDKSISIMKGEVDDLQQHVNKLELLVQRRSSYDLKSS